MVRADGVDLHYDELGSGDTVVVTAQQRFADDDLAHQLAQQYRVFALTLRQLSQLDDGRSRWYPRWSADVFAATRALGLDRFVYTGTSHGAIIGWHLAVEHPEVLRGLVAIVGVPHPRARKEVAGRASQMAARDDIGALRHGLESLFGPTTDPDRLARRPALIEARVAQVLATAPEEASVSLGIAFPDVESDAELEQLLQRINTRTLILGGMHDPWVTPENMLRTARAVRASALVMFEDESHLLAVESPRKVLDQFRIFVDGL